MTSRRRGLACSRSQGSISLPKFFVAKHLSGQNFEMRLDAALVDQKGAIHIIPNALAGF